MAEYSSLLAESVLRHKAWLAEHQARIERELASQVKSQFIANMSHELRTPLNTVIGFAKLIGEHQQRPLKAEEVVEYADLIRDAATHLLAVLNDILDISKMQSGKYTIDAREVALDEISRFRRPPSGRPRWRPRSSSSAISTPSCRQSRAIRPSCTGSSPT
jgi:two-component system cell cycle sensor histidine kinase PleC